jgi:hypothetical protein
VEIDRREDYDYSTLKGKGTGSHEGPDEYKIIVYPFDRYEIKVKLTPANEFVGIVEVSLNKDFLSYRQKTMLPAFHDVDEFYRD